MNPNFERDITKQINDNANAAVDRVIKNYEGNDVKELAGLLDKELQKIGLALDADYLQEVATNILTK